MLLKINIETVNLHHDLSISNGILMASVDDAKLFFFCLACNY